MVLWHLDIFLQREAKYSCLFSTLSNWEIWYSKGWGINGVCRESGHCWNPPRADNSSKPIPGYMRGFPGRFSSHTSYLQRAISSLCSHAHPEYLLSKTNVGTTTVLHFPAAIHVFNRLTYPVRYVVRYCHTQKYMMCYFYSDNFELMKQWEEFILSFPTFISDN